MEQMKVCRTALESAVGTGCKLVVVVLVKRQGVVVKVAAEAFTIGMNSIADAKLVAGNDLPLPAHGL